MRRAIRTTTKSVAGARRRRDVARVLIVLMVSLVALVGSAFALVMTDAGMDYVVEPVLVHAEQRNDRIRRRVRPVRPPIRPTAMERGPAVEVPRSPRVFAAPVDSVAQPTLVTELTSDPGVESELHALLRAIADCEHRAAARPEPGLVERLRWLHSLLPCVSSEPAQGLDDSVSVR